MKRKIYLFLLLGTLLIIMCACKKKDAVIVTASDNEVAEVTEVYEEIEADRTEPVSLLIHICGAVSNPGVYELSEGDRICHAVEKAGGFTTRADQNYLNQAQKLTDGMRIYIPTQEETALAAEDIFPISDDLQRAKENESCLININTATLEQLCNLPGIGEGKAQSIIAYREEKGSYTSIEEIMNVEGIKEGLFEKIRDRITVS